jgi:hypothetical protein
MSGDQRVGWELSVETEVLGENLPQCHFIHHKSYMIWHRLEPVPSWWKSGYYTPELWHGPSLPMVIVEPERQFDHSPQSAVRFLNSHRNTWTFPYVFLFWRRRRMLTCFVSSSRYKQILGENPKIGCHHFSQFDASQLRILPHLIRCYVTVLTM